MSIASFLGTIGGLIGFGSTPAPEATAAPATTSKPSRDVSARYDAAQTGPMLSNHWSMADGLSADAANSPHVRKILRERSRMECGNNPNACGIVRKLGNDVVGTGPRVQCLLPSTEANRQIEQAFADWAKQIRFAKKLRMMRQTKSRDGEVFAMLTTNPKLKHVVKLDFRPIECDQVTNPQWTGVELDEIDGVRFDTYGNVTEFCVLKNHPGANGMTTSFFEHDWVPAQFMIHSFLLERPGQHRGIPEMTSSLSLFAMARGYTDAVLATARFAATPHGVIESEVGDDGEQDTFDPLTTMNFPAGITTIGGGNKLTQLKPEQPTTSHHEYTTDLHTLAVQPISMTRNIATGDSSSYNFSSAKLDGRLYYKAIGIDQYDLELECVDEVFDAFWIEYRDLADGLPADVVALDRIPHECHWDQPVDVDPEKTANAREKSLKTGMTSFQTEYAALGLDAETEMRKQAQICGLEYEDYVARVVFNLLPAVPEDATPEAAATPATAVQDTALNGAQSASLLAIVVAVAAGTMPLETARGMIASSFPFLLPEQIDAIIKPLATFKATALPDGSPVLAPGTEDPSATATAATPAASAGAFVGTNRRDFSNNMKATNDVLKAFMAGTSEVLTRAALVRLGWSAEDAQGLIDDARDGRIDNPPAAAPAPVAEVPTNA